MLRRTLNLSAQGTQVWIAALESIANTETTIFGLRLMLTLALGMMCSTALGANVWHTSKIHSVYPKEDGAIIIQLDTDPPSCTNGNSPKYLYVSVGENYMTEEGLKNIYALLLTALTTDRQVSVYFSDSSVNCYIKRAKMY